MKKITFIIIFFPAFLLAQKGAGTIGSGTDGTVTSVGLSMPNILTVSGSPVITSGTLSGTLASQLQNRVFASPDGSAGAPTFRALVAADLPSLSGTYLPLAGGTMGGNILFTDNTYDIGASGATRPRTGYFGTSVLSPIFNAATGYQIAGAATSGNYLRGNGTNFVSSAIQAGDIPALPYFTSGANTITSNTTFNGTFDWRMGNTTALDTVEIKAARVILNGTTATELFTNGTKRLTLDSSGGIRSNTVTDVILTPSDSLKISGATVDIAGAVKITGATTATGDITVPTEAYDATGWNGDLTVPTKDAVRDKIEALTGWNHSATQNIDMNNYNITEGNLATFDTVTVTTSTYASGWNGDNTVPTKDAVYDQMETKATKGGDSGTITLGSNTGSLHLESDGTRRMTIPEAGIASTTSATKALFLSSNDSLQYTTIQHGNWSDNAVIANSTRTDTLLNGGVAYGRLIRVGTTVDFTVRFEVGLGSDTTSNIVYMPLPISSNFTSPSTDVIGTADVAAQGVYGGNPIKIERVILYADDTGDRIAVAFTVDKQGASYPANRIWITAKGSYDIK